MDLGSSKALGVFRCAAGPSLGGLSPGLFESTASVPEEGVLAIQFVREQELRALEGLDRVRGSSEGELSVPERTADVALEGTAHILVACPEQLACRALLSSAQKEIEGFGIARSWIVQDRARQNRVDRQTQIRCVETAVLKKGKGHERIEFCGRLAG